MAYDGGYAAVIMMPNGKYGFYGYGETEALAREAFRRQILGGTASMQAHMRRRMMLQPLTPEQASDLLESCSADAIGWE